MTPKTIQKHVSNIVCEMFRVDNINQLWVEKGLKIQRNGEAFKFFAHSRDEAAARQILSEFVIQVYSRLSESPFDMGVPTTVEVNENNVATLLVVIRHESDDRPFLTGNGGMILDACGLINVPDLDDATETETVEPVEAAQVEQPTDIQGDSQDMPVGTDGTKKHSPRKLEIPEDGQMGVMIIENFNDPRKRSLVEVHFTEANWEKYDWFMRNANKTGGYEFYMAVPGMKRPQRVYAAKKMAVEVFELAVKSGDVVYQNDGALVQYKFVKPE